MVIGTLVAIPARIAAHNSDPCRNCSDPLPAEVTTSPAESTESSNDAAPVTPETVAAIREAGPGSERAREDETNSESLDATDEAGYADEAVLAASGEFEVMLANLSLLPITRVSDDDIMDMGVGTG